MTPSAAVAHTEGQVSSVPSPTRSLLRELVAVSARPDILSLAGGLPDPDLFPVHEYGDALHTVISADSTALQYGPPFQPLKHEIVELMSRRGVSCSADEILLTTGAQQAISIVAGLLVDPFQSVLSDRVTYPGLSQALAALHPAMMTVNLDLTSGTRVEEVASMLARGQRPAFMYVIPDGHNPYGVSLAPTQRRRLVSLAREYRVPIVEDDPYGFLCYDGPHAPPLRSLDADWVFYIGTFSKTIAPALRLGWMVLPADLVPDAERIKEASDLECSALTQRAVACYLQRGQFGAQLDRLRGVYRRRRDALLTALHEHFPSGTGTRWTNPRGGFFVWVELARAFDGGALLRAAIEDEHVAFVPGHAFAIDGSGSTASTGLRLSFSSCTPAEIEEAVRRLAQKQE